MDVQHNTSQMLSLASASVDPTHETQMLTLANDSVDPDNDSVDGPAQEIKEDETVQLVALAPPQMVKKRSLFKKVDIEDLLKQHVELKDSDITDMLKTQKEYQQFGKCTCCGHKALSGLARIKSLLITILFCAGGLVLSFFLSDADEELSDRIFFYTIYLSFLLFCIPLTGFINYFVMLFLLTATKDTWKVFYIKGIKKRLHLSILSVLWFAGFYTFGNAYEYDYNANIFAAIVCVLVSSTAFLATHLFIRYSALNSFFEVFKIEARKIKTYVTMIEMMANMPKKRKEYKANNKTRKKKKNTTLTFNYLPGARDEDKPVYADEKEQDKPETLFSIPVMNFLIDFPSSPQKNKAKKERKTKVSFSLVSEDRKSVEAISKHITKHDDDDSEQQQQTSDHNNSVQPQHVNVENANENEKEEEKEEESIDEWLNGNELSPVMKTPLNQLNVKTLNDLEELLSDLYNHQFGYQSDKINTSKMNAINQIQRNVLSDNNVPYSAWKHFAVAAQHFIKTPTDDNEIDGVQKKKTNKDIDEVDEILGLQYELYSINLSSNIQSVKIINDENLDRLTRVVSHLIFTRLKEFKERVNSGDIRLDFGKQISEFGEKAVAALTIRPSKHGAGADLFVDDPDKIYWDTVKAMFRHQEGNNKRLLQDLAYYAWLKFAPRKLMNKDENPQSKAEQKEEAKHNKHGYDALDVDLLNIDIFKIFQDLLLLKQSIDSYTIIIVNLQRMVDVVTPLLLLFVYLYIFDFNFQDALGFYISIVGIIGFFGSAYFSSVFASISFIMALDPYLVGDILCYDGEYYQVQKISLISCIFKHLQTGQLCTYQNKHLGESSLPIINLSRTEGSNKLKYRWVLYFKHSVTNGQLNIFKKRCKELISKNKITKSCAFWTIKVRSNQMDDFQRKKVNVQMKYDFYNNDINSICFNYCTQAMTELSYNWQPLANMNNAQWFPEPADE